MQDLCLSTNIIDLVHIENFKQLERRGVQNHDPFKWLSFAFEEAGETAQAINDWKFESGTPSAVVTEAIQCATLFLKIAEMFSIKGVNSHEMY